MVCDNPSDIFATVPNWHIPSLQPSHHPWSSASQIVFLKRDNQYKQLAQTQRTRVALDNTVVEHLPVLSLGHFLERFLSYIYSVRYRIVREERQWLWRREEVGIDGIEVIVAVVVFGDRVVFIQLVELGERCYAMIRVLILDCWRDSLYFSKSNFGISWVEIKGLWRSNSTRLRCSGWRLSLRDPSLAVFFWRLRRRVT